MDLFPEEWLVLYSPSPPGVDGYSPLHTLSSPTWWLPCLHRRGTGGLGLVALSPSPYLEAFGWLHCLSNPPSPGEEPFRWLRCLRGRVCPR